MEKINRAEILKNLEDIKIKSDDFFHKSTEIIGTEEENPPFHYTIKERDFFWVQITEDLHQMGKSLITRIVELAPTIAEAVRLTPFLTAADQQDLGQAVKGLKSSLNLCNYKSWGIEILHDEGIVLGVQPPGQSDDEALHPTKARKVFGDCFRKVFGIVELLSPSTVEFAELQIERKGKNLVLGYNPGTAFIMMWMDPSVPGLNDTSNTVKRCFEKFDIKAIRADDIQHEDLITQKIIEKIQTSEFLFADLTAERPSVYYEVGYAHAIGRRVILFRKKNEPIHFDLAGYNCPQYFDLTELEQSLMKRLASLTGRNLK